MARGKLLSKGNSQIRNREIFFVKAAAAMRGSGKPYDYAKLGKIYDPSEQLPEVKARKIMYRPEITNMIAAEIATLLADQGINPETVLKKELQLLEDCKDDDGKFIDRNIAHKIIESQKKLVGLYDNGAGKVKDAEPVSFIEMKESAEVKRIAEE